MKKFDALTDNKIMLVTKVGEIRHVLAHTEKGELTVGLSKGQGDLQYRFYLDAVPFSEENNKQLLEIFNEETVA